MIPALVFVLAIALLIGWELRIVYQFERLARIENRRDFARQLRRLGYETVEPTHIDRPDHPVLLDNRWNHCLEQLVRSD